MQNFGCVKICILPNLCTGSPWLASSSMIVGMLSQNFYFKISGAYVCVCVCVLCVCVRGGGEVMRGGGSRFILLINLKMILYLSDNTVTVYSTITK